MTEDIENAEGGAPEPHPDLPPPSTLPPDTAPNVYLVGAVCAVVGAVIGVAMTLSLLPPAGEDPPARPAGLAVGGTGDGAGAAGTDGTPSIPDADPRLLSDASRPASGTALLQTARSGLGAFVVENHTARDAVIVLSRDSVQERGFYVRSGDRVTAPSVAPGTYRIQVTHGITWREGRFTVEPAYGEFDRPAEFVERSTPGGTDSTSLTVTLQGGSGGLAQTRPLPPFTLQPQP